MSSQVLRYVETPVFHLLEMHRHWINCLGRCIPEAVGHAISEGKTKSAVSKSESDCSPKALDVFFHFRGMDYHLFYIILLLHMLSS